MIPPAWPHHRIPQNANRIGSGNIAIDPGILNWNLATKAETMIAVMSATWPKNGSSRTDDPANADTASVNRNKNPIKTRVGVR
jgi:hypothetical protein